DGYRCKNNAGSKKDPNSPYCHIHQKTKCKQEIPCHKEQPRQVKEKTSQFTSVRPPFKNVDHLIEKLKPDPKCQVNGLKIIPFLTEISQHDHLKNICNP